MHEVARGGTGQSIGETHLPIKSRRSVRGKSPESARTARNRSSRTVLEKSRAELLLRQTLSRDKRASTIFGVRVYARYARRRVCKLMKPERRRGRAGYADRVQHGV